MSDAAPRVEPAALGAATDSGLEAGGGKAVGDRDVTYNLVGWSRDL
ncbi:MAG: hypothetical protein ACOYLS_14045 [Polymorphobacter sp.]